MFLDKKIFSSHVFSTTAEKGIKWFKRIVIASAKWQPPSCAPFCILFAHQAQALSAAHIGSVSVILCGWNQKLDDAFEEVLFKSNVFL
jgi:hypothetical protein